MKIGSGIKKVIEKIKGCTFFWNTVYI